MHYFHTKLPYQKPMERQIKWWLQNGPIKKNRVLPVTTLFFWKFCFSLRTSYKELICCTNYPNAYICTFCKCWSFIWQCFFPVSIFKSFCTQSLNGLICVEFFKLLDLPYWFYFNKFRYWFISWHKIFLDIWFVPLNLFHLLWKCFFFRFLQQFQLLACRRKSF